MPKYNAMMAYSSPNGSFSLNLPVNKISHRWEVVATESHAKRYRAMYPRQRAVAQFAITPQLKGYNELRQLMRFIGSFTETVVYGAAQPMLVILPDRDFIRRGFPIKGMIEQDHVGSMVFEPTIIFEAVTDPLDQRLYTQNSQNISQWDFNNTENDIKNFFYPFSRASYDTQVRPETVYDLNPNDDVTPWRVPTYTSGGGTTVPEQSLPGPGG